jgi:hypothetical protein
MLYGRLSLAIIVGYQHDPHTVIMPPVEKVRLTSQASRENTRASSVFFSQTETTDDDDDVMIGCAVTSTEPTLKKD